VIPIPADLVDHLVWLAGFAAGGLACVAAVLVITGVRALLARRRWDRVLREQERALRRRRYHHS
jgi:hypothetical protein